MKLVIMYLSLLIMNIGIITHATAVFLRMRKKQCHFYYTNSLLSVFFYMVICYLSLVVEIRFLYVKALNDCIVALLLMFQYFLLFPKGYVFIGDIGVYMDGHFFRSMSR